MVDHLLGARPARKMISLLRPHQPGDLGWVVHCHAVLYARERGWDEQFEALVAEIAADFLKKYDARWERRWMAEMEGEIVGDEEPHHSFGHDLVGQTWELTL